MILFTFYFVQDKLLQFSPSKRLTAEQVMSAAVSLSLSVSVSVPGSVPGSGSGSVCVCLCVRVHVCVCVRHLSLACFISREREIISLSHA